jgi:hypothetical protein
MDDSYKCASTVVPYLAYPDLPYTAVSYNKVYRGGRILRPAGCLFLGCRGMAWHGIILAMNYQ